MKVAYWYNNNDIRIKDVPLPQPTRMEMLVKVMACGICGSDVVEWYRLPRAPLVLGHEIGAEVVSVGSSVKKFKPGDRVFIAPKIPCMKCFYCKNGHYPQCSEIQERLPGGFAEFIVVPEKLVHHACYPLPEKMTFEQSTFIEPLACVIRAQRLARIKKGQSVMIIGCGMSGLLHIKLARLKGCKIIAADIQKKKLETAAAIGADIALDGAKNIPQRLQEKNGKKADIVILCTSADSAVEQAWLCVDKGGVIVFFAVPAPDKNVLIPINDFWMKEITVLTSYYCGPPDIAEAMKLIEWQSVTVDDLITHRLPLTDIVKGFQLVQNGRESIKVIIQPHAEPQVT